MESNGAHFHPAVHLDPDVPIKAEHSEGNEQCTAYDRIEFGGIGGFTLYFPEGSLDALYRLGEAALRLHAERLAAQPLVEAAPEMAGAAVRRT